ncbi:MAG TPA: glycosyltransferase [Pseudorhizobium sp.]|nr:glycosyltransferase [Pseudorhizobium sp.]
MLPLVTIGVTSYNCESSLDRAICSALDQDWPALEIVIVDDASSDRTWEKILALSTIHPNIRAFRQSENGGVAAARNRILAEARGEFVAFFDDDDVSAPGRVRRQVERITGYEAELSGGAPVICHTARRQVGTDGSTRVEPTMGQQEGKLAPRGEAVAHRILFGAPLEDGYGALATCSQMARTQTYRQIGGFDPVFRRVEDTDFCVRLALVGGHFVGIAEPLVTQTLTPTSDKSLEGELAFKLMLVDKHRAVFAGEEHYRYCREWLITKHHWLAGDRIGFAARMGVAALRHPLWTWQRLRLALPNLEGNRAFSRFHRAAKRS